MSDHNDSDGSEKPVGEMSFEEAMAALEKVVGELERGDVPLEESISALRARRDTQETLRGQAQGGRGKGRRDHP